MGYLLGVIGNPVKHSLSPWIHERFLELANFNGIYRSYEIDEPSLKPTMQVFKLMDVDGFNVTIPYKEKILDYLDEMDKTAIHVGAVNTVVNQNGKWIGYNTDGLGYIRSLRNSYADFFRDLERKKVLLIGAGGAARGIYHALNVEGLQHIDIANRTVSRAENIRLIKGENVQSRVMTLLDTKQVLDQYDLIIQTTNIGMTPNAGLSPIECNKFKDNAILSDIIYNPMKTHFLKSGQKNGARIHYGHGMLLYQAQAAFELWTGVKINPAKMLHELEQKLMTN